MAFSETLLPYMAV